MRRKDIAYFCIGLSNHTGYIYLLINQSRFAKQVQVAEYKQVFFYQVISYSTKYFSLTSHSSLNPKYSFDYQPIMIELIQVLFLKATSSLIKYYFDKTLLTYTNTDFKGLTNHYFSSLGRFASFDVYNFRLS